MKYLCCYTKLDESDSSEEFNSKNQKKKKQTMNEVFSAYQSSYPERYAKRAEYFKAVSQSKVLSKFQVETPDNLVENGYNTSHNDARLKKIELACFFSPHFDPHFLDGLRNLH